MTDETTAPKTRKPTSSEKADEALEQVGQLRVELTEIRDALREGGPVAPVGSSSEAEIKRIDGDLDDFIKQVGMTFGEQANHLSGIQNSVDQLGSSTADTFTELKGIVNDWGAAITAMRKTINAFQGEVAANGLQVAELAEKVRLFDEAGAAPASAEDVSSLDDRLKRLEVVQERMQLDPGQGLESLATRLGRVEAHVCSGTRPASATGRYDAAKFGTGHVYEGLQALMAAVTEIGKDKQADQKMGGYSFRSIDAAMDAVGNALRRDGVALAISPGSITSKKVERYTEPNSYGKDVHWTHVWVNVRYTVTSLIDGSEMFFEMSGEARDPGDKATSKAVSMAYKYMLTQGLCIPIKGLPESDGGDPPEQFERPNAGQKEWEDDRTYRVVDEPSEPPVGFREASSRDAMPDNPKPVDDRTPEERANAAMQALAAIPMLEQGARRVRFSAVLGGIKDHNLNQVEIVTPEGEKMPLIRYATVINAVISQGGPRG